jgi:hypothetical protein
MTRPRLLLWLYAIAGLLWLLVGVLRLVRHSSTLEIIFDFAFGCFFLLFAWQQLKKLRPVNDRHA